MAKKKAKKDNDYKGKKSFRFTNKDHIKAPKSDVMEIVVSSQKSDKWRGRSHHKKRMDYITGNYYQYKKQKKYKSLCGDRGNGLFSLSNILKGEIAFVAELPGIAMPKNMIRTQKSGNHFIGRKWNANACHIMKANIISMKNEMEVEQFNGRLDSWSHQRLLKHGYMVEGEGMFSVIIATEDIQAKSFVNLKNYENTKEYPYGCVEYLEMEKQVIQLYNEKCLERKVTGPRCSVCRMCCQLYPKVVGGSKNIHLKECEGNLLSSMWENRVIIVK